jgi:mannose-6-phosphate isomerase
VTRASFERALHEGTVPACIHTLYPAAGDSLFVPSGRVHALGAGLVVFEIQQNSDTTYRVFDWHRVGLDGKPRALHVEESMRCIDFSDVEPALTRNREELASCEFFRVSRRSSGGPPAREQGRLIMAIAPTVWGGLELKAADLALCPYSLSLPDPVGEWLEIEY